MADRVSETALQLSEHVSPAPSRIGRQPRRALLPFSSISFYAIIDLATAPLRCQGEVFAEGDEHVSMSRTQTLWNVPYQRNPFFTGREELLKHMHLALHAENTAMLAHPQGITGLGGIGKTQTALEYAYRYRHEYAAVFWVHAETTLTLASSLMELAHVLQLPERDEPDQRIIVEAVLRWLRLHAGWLVIFDNLDDIAVAEPFLPKTGPGHLLFTTRAHSLGGIAQRLEVQTMEQETGALFLLRRAGLLPLTDMLDRAPLEENGLAHKISQEMDGLPLALDQAGAYIKETPSTLQEYLTLYETRRNELFQIRGNSEENYPASVATTWALSFERISHHNPAAAELLDFCAFLSPDAIPEELLTRGAAFLSPLLQSIAINPLQLDRAIAALLAYSLINRNADANILSIHRLVQAVLQDAMEAQVQSQWIERTIRVVHHEFLFGDMAVEKWPQYERVLPHAIAVTARNKEWDDKLPEMPELLTNTATYLGNRSRYEEAELLYARTLQVLEQALGPEHVEVASSMHNLATVYAEQGNYTAAEKLYQRALGIREREMGSAHPEVANSLHSLAILYTEQGYYKKAELLHQRALQIREQVLEPGHFDIASSLNSQASLYKDLGKYTKAEQFYQRALSIYKRALGIEHPDVAMCLDNLASLYVEMDNYAEAEQLYQQALQLRERVLGADHASVAMNLNNLATLYSEQEKYEEAELLYQRALEIYKQKLGPEHPKVASCLNNLATLYKDLGRYAEAEALYQQALHMYAQASGSEHPDVAMCLDNLGTLYREQGKYTEAESLYQRAIQIQEQALGLEHPDVATTLNNLASLYSEQEKYEEAEPLYQRALRMYEGASGAEHPDVAMTLNNLATLYVAQEKFEKAGRLYRRVLRIYQKARGPEHTDVANSLNNLANVYHEQRKYKKAEPLYQQALHLYEQLLGATHHDVAMSLNNLAVLYEEPGKTSEAEQLYHRAFMIYQQNFGNDHLLKTVAENYVRIAKLIHPEP